MSTSYYSTVIVGVPLKDIYKAEVKTEEKTKYHEDTGKPYKVKVKRLHATFGNKTLPPVDERVRERYTYSDSEEFSQDWDFLEKLGLETHLPSSERYTSPEYVMNHGLVGIAASTVSSRDLEMDEDQPGLTLATLSATADKVKAVLAQFGYTGEIKVYSQLSWG